ncbi:MAG: hypothetical protein GX960_06980 [Actinomycetales bacterium]|nr:hypothetical protein [Actinomycetales bacterium]
MGVDLRDPIDLRPQQPRTAGHHHPRLGEMAEVLERVIEPALAAVLVWRTVTVAGPILLGVIALVLWKRSSGRRAL